MIRIIIENGGNINAKKKGLNALFHALDDKVSLDTFETLLELGIGMDHTDKKGNSIVHLCKNLDKLKLLVKYNADFNIRNKKYHTPVFICNDYKKVELLIEGGINLNVVDNKGKHFLRTINSSDFDLMRVYTDHGLSRYLEKGGFILDKFIETRATSEILVYYEHKLLTQPHKYSRVLKDNS